MTVAQKKYNGELTADIVVNESLEGSPRVWTPICQGVASPYKGKFDGGGHTVKGLYYSSTTSYVGLFGVSGGELKNVGVIDSDISGGNHVGGVCGYNDGGTVTNCYSKGSVKGTENVGGVCGYNYSGTVTDCYNEGSVSSTGSKVGGVCGNNESGTVTNCSNKGSVSGNEKVGGVCGYNYSDDTVTGCHNEGRVSGNAQVGGVCGYNASTVTSCYNKGGVSGTGSEIGGVCGYNGNTVKSCYNTGEVSGNGSTGGVCGKNSGGTVTGSYNTGKVSGTGKYIGGICGSIGSGTVKSCYNTGEVSGNERIGGVCGNNISGTVENCYNMGGVSGTEHVGGVCGYNGDTVTSCYNMGGVSGTGSNVGGVCGRNYNGTVTNCYYLGDSETDSFDGTTYKTEADFNSGAVCWLLNNSAASADSAWGQNVGMDMRPVFGGPVVYQYTLGSSTFYSNGAEAAADNNGVYEIDSADELRWFVDAVNNAGLMADAKLTADIYLNGCAWNCMNTYAGTFDGEGHTISGLNGHKDYTPNIHGFIRTLANGGVVKNLTFTGAKVFNHEGDGAISAVIVYTNNGTVENCVVKSSNIHHGGYDALGVVVGVNGGTIRNCASISNTMTRRYSSNKNVCGFVWSNSGSIENCFNYDCTYQNGSNRYAFTQSNTGTITNCYYYESSETLSDATVADVIKSKTAEAFESGEVTYLLNGSTIKGDLAWGQTLGTDKYPVVKTEDNTVCKVPTEETYSNHNQYGSTGFCISCGGFQKPEIVNDEYRIANIGQLLWFAEYVNSGNKSANAKLTADIDMSNISWTTICETGLYYKQYGSDDGYSGTFDGNGHVISNLKVTSSADAATSVGLFGTVSGTIKNLGIESFTLVDSGKDMRAGAIVGQLIKTGKVSNCYVKVADIQTGDNVAGGIAGCVYEGTVENCYAVNVTVNGASGRFGYVTGDVCADGNSADGTQSWYQTLKTDTYPVPDNTHGTVYSIFACDGRTPAGYSNENKNKSHADENGDGYCDVCGTKKDGISATLAGHSVSLGGQIGMNFYMDLDASVLGDDSAYMLYTLPDGSTQEVDVNDAKTENIGENTYYIFTCEVAAKDMADTITAKVVCSDGNGGTVEGTEYTYSVQQYAEALINKDGASDEEKALAKAMLNYGAYAQKYFNPDVAAGELANVNHPYAEGELTVATSGLKSYAPQVNDEDDALAYAGSTLILESNIKVRHYLKLTDETASGNLSGLTLYEAPEGETVDGTYYFFEKEFVATKLGDMEEYTVEGIKFKYCPLSYVITLLAEKTEGTEYLYQDEANDMPLQNLMKALYLYHEATMDYKKSVAN